MEEQSTICKHLEHSIRWSLARNAYSQPCKECRTTISEEPQECNVCCVCNVVLCSDKKNSHMREHFKKNPKHCIAFDFSNLKFFCFQCEKEVYCSNLEPFHASGHQQKLGVFPFGYGFHSFGKCSKEILIEFKKMFQQLKPLGGSIDIISKRKALPLLQKVLDGDLFKRVKKGYDVHGVFDFDISRNVLDLEDDERVEFEEFISSGKRLKKHANSFRLFYVKDVCNFDDIPLNFSNKAQGRTWNRIFHKHFYITISEIDVQYNWLGLPLPRDMTDEEEENKLQEILLVTPVGIDVSAHRLTGVHFGDLLRYLSRKDGQPMTLIDEEAIKKRELEKKKMKKKKKKGLFSFLSLKKKEPKMEKSETKEVEKEEEGRIDASLTKIWTDAFEYWIPVDRNPGKIYNLLSNTLQKDYEIMFGLMFSALQKLGVEVPLVVGIGCGVFGRAFFPEYQETVSRAYRSVLSQNGYGFKAVILCDVTPRNVEVYSKVFEEDSETSFQTPVFICKFDILVCARLVAEKYKCSIMNAGTFAFFSDFQKEIFGNLGKLFPDFLIISSQFFEGGGALEEYIARMSDGYFSQQYMINPNVLNEENYIGISTEELGIKIDEENVLDLKEFIKSIQCEFKIEESKNYRGF